MANNLGVWAQAAALDWLMGGSSPTRPSNRYVALFTATPSATGGGTEVSGGGYARQALTCAASSGAPATTSNTSAITWTASGANFGTVTSIGIFDAATGGDLLWWGPLSQARTILNGDSFTFPASALALSLD